MSFKKCLSIALIVLTAHARELQDLSLDITTAKGGSEAKQDAFDQATEQGAARIAEDLLGGERMARYWPGLKAKLMKNSRRFVLFIKGSPPQDTGGGMQKITVSLRLSPDAIETWLREEGVLNSGGVKVLPLVEVSDSHGARFLWWAAGQETNKSTSVQDFFTKFFTHVTAKFKSKNTYVLDPTKTSFRMAIPAAYRGENLKREEQMLFAQYLKADVVLSGRVSVTRLNREGAEAKLDYDLQLWQAKSGRLIGEVQRSESVPSDSPKVVLATLEQSEKKVIEDLSHHLVESLNAGNLNLNVVKIALSGAMSYRQQAELKRQMAQMREIRILKERLLEPGRVTFEAETPVTTQELAQAFKKARFPLYMIEVVSAQDESLALNVKALSSASAE